MGCSENKLLSTWGFELLNGNTEVMNIVDPLLDTKERAKERAMSEFLKNSYGQVKITLSTHVLTFRLNDTITVGGVPYLIKNINIVSDRVTIKSVLGLQRYD